MLTVLLAAWAITGCGRIGAYDITPYHHFHLQEEAHLTTDASSPFCDFDIDYSCLNEEGDSIAKLINRAIQREFLGEGFASLSPEVAVDSFKNTYLRDYRKEVGEIYLADKANSASEEEIPTWYNQDYSMVTFVENGCEGVLNASANFYVDTGGAHPNQWSRWINFDTESGKQLTQENVFVETAKADIERLLLDRLIQMQAKLYPNETLNTLEDLQQKGFLQLTDMYIPDNFLLSKEAVLFLFNRYDIAPYAAGEIIIKVSYEEIGQWIKNWK